MNDTIEHRPLVSRFEVVDKTGRVLTRRDLDGVLVAVQDDERTLKVFLDWDMQDYPRSPYPAVMTFEACFHEAATESAFALKLALLKRGDGVIEVTVRTPDEAYRLGGLMAEKILR